MRLATVILAAGQGTRMKSNMAKVLHPVGGKPMVERAVALGEQLNADRMILVIGRDADTVRAHIGDRVEYVVQAEQLGTGHAVMQAESTLREQAEIVLVFYADMPLLRADTVARLVEAQQQNSGPITMLTAEIPEPRGFGRVLRHADGSVSAIVEEKEATPEQLAIRELNAGVYAFDGAWLWDALQQVEPKSKGEYYLTDLIEIAVAAAQRVEGIKTDDISEIIGVNTRVHLSEAETALRKRVNEYWMLEGVTIIDPATTYIHEAAQIGQDTVLLPGTHIWGASQIGAGCRIGPNAMIRDTRVGDDCQIGPSMLEEAIVEDNVRIGPFCHLRPGAHLESGVHMGNFGEVKNSRLGRETRMGHFSYIGDADVGEDVNIGAGTITANYDGVRKNKTIIGDHAFIGSDTMLVAPVTIAEHGRTAAGSVVTHDVPSGHIAVGVPARLRELRLPDHTE